MSGVLIPNLDTGSTPVSSIEMTKRTTEPDRVLLFFIRYPTEFSPDRPPSKKKIARIPRFSPYFRSFFESLAAKGFRRFPPHFHRLSTVPDRQITPQYTTFQQLPAHSPQVIHRFFLRSLIDTFVASGSTITLPQNLWQNLATSVQDGDSASAVAQLTPDLANVFGLTDFYLD
jgi:hypothetical protein